MTARSPSATMRVPAGADDHDGDRARLEGPGPAAPPIAYYPRGSAWDDRRADRLIDVGFAATVMFAILFNRSIGPLTPLIVSVSIPAFAILRWHRMPRIFAISWPLLLLPIFALASAVWSFDPAATIRYGILFLASVIVATIMGAGIRHEDLLKATFWALFAFGIASLVSGRMVGWGGPGGAAFAGLLDSKNAMGEVTGVALIASFAMLFQAVAKGWKVTIGIAVAAVLVAAVSLWFSRATGALIAATVASACLFMWVASRRLGRQARTLIFVMALLSLLVLAVTSDLWLPQLFDLVLQSSGKDAGLTGRVDLWAKADQMITERPWFGMGYEAFWRHNNLDAEYLWRLMGIAGRSGFNFHNTAREITVSLGYVGLSLYAAIALIGALFLIIRTMLTPTIPLIFASALLVYFVFKLHFESFGFGGMHLLGMLAYVILTMGYARKGARK